MSDLILNRLNKGEYVNNPKENGLLELYEEMGLGKCEICQKCRGASKTPDDRSEPIGAWCIGSAFYEQSKRVLFVGKNARSKPGIIRGTFRDAFAVTREFLWWEYYDDDGKPAAMPSAYWGYTAKITEDYFGKDTPEYIAFTNIVKCNDSPDIDTTTGFVKDCCIKRLHVLKKEIKYINPTHIIFYTGRSYDEYIKDKDIEEPAIFDSYRIIKDEEKQVGKLFIPWLELDGYIDNTHYHVLRTGHPERKNKADFVNNVVDWIKSR